MPRKSASAPDDPEQSKRFVETARELGTDDRPEEFDRVFGKVTDRPSKSASRNPSGQKS